MKPISLFFSLVIGEAPLLVAYFAGMALALALWRRCSKAAMFTLIATSLLFAAGLVEPLLSVYLFLARHDLETRQQTLIFGAIGMVLNLIRAAAVGLLLAAAFTGRKTPPPAT